MSSRIRSLPREGRRLFREECGLIIAGMVIRTAILLAILGLVINDGGHLVAAQVKAESVARAAASAGADTYFRTKRADMAKRDAYAAAQQMDAGATVTFFQVTRDGTVTIGVEKSANTLVVKRVGFLKKYVIQSATDEEIRSS